jgi:hypothetical protein
MAQEKRAKKEMKTKTKTGEREEKKTKGADARNVTITPE